MSLWRPNSLRRLHVAWGLDARELAWQQTNAAEGTARRAVHAQALPLALAQLPRGVGVDVVAANDVAVHWLQTPPSSVASLDELRLVAAARCSQLYGGSSRDWWVAADWNALAPFVCGALPRSIVGPLQLQLAAAGVTARWHTAWGVACGSGTNTFPAHGWSALRSPTRVLLWHCSEGQVDCLNLQSVSVNTTDEDARAQAQRQARIEGIRDASLSVGPLHWINMGRRGEVAANEAVAALGIAALIGGAAS